MNQKENAASRVSVDAVVIPVFWKMCGDGTIHRSNAIRIFNGRVEFDDGGWNPVEDCFLTEEQCRKHHDIPPRDWKESRDVVVGKLHDLIAELSG